MEQPKKQNGGRREGAGRKPKADEIKLLEMMDSIGDSKEIFQKLFEKAKAGNNDCAKTWLAYRFGMPKQKVEADVEIPMLPRFGENPLESL